MIGWRMGTYIASHFFKSTMLIFLLFFALIVGVDLIELSKTLAKSGNGVFGDIFNIAILRAPSIAGRVLPFAVLFGATLSLLLLNRRLELVIARASGVSVWQFLLPLAITAAIIGAFSSFVYNPLSLTAVQASQAIEARLFGRVKGSFSNKSSNFWLRVGENEGDAIIRARVSQNGGQNLTAVSIYRFDRNGTIIERLDAEKADFERLESGGNGYRLTNLVATIPGQSGVIAKERVLRVNISSSQLQTNTALPDRIGFWNLQEQAERARASGRNYLAFLTRYEHLLSRPLLFVAMVLLAGCVSLRFSRFGQNGKLILGGVLAGFVLYVMTEIVLTFGSNGFVSPAMAAWSPAIVASLFGVTVLLHQEDG